MRYLIGRLLWAVLILVAVPFFGRGWCAVCLISLIAHSGLFYLFLQEPQPLLGIGTETITVELEIGDNRPTGASPNQGASQVETPRVDEVKPDDKAAEDQKAVEAREVKPEETRTEAAKEQAVEQPKEQKPDERQRIAYHEAKAREEDEARRRAMG